MIFDRLSKFTPDLTMDARLGVLIPFVNGLLADSRVTPEIKREIETAVVHMVRAAVIAKQTDQ